MLVGEVDDPVAHALHELRAEADHEEHDELERVQAEDDEVEEDDVAVGVEEELEAGEQHEKRKEDERELEHDEARELCGRGLAHVEAGAREAIDLRGDRARHHGCEVAEEDAGGFHAHEVAHANGRVVIEPHGDDVGEDAEDEVAHVAEAGVEDPATVNVLERVDELGHLAREDEEDDVGTEHAEDEEGALASLLLVLLLGDVGLLAAGGDAAGVDLDLGLGLGRYRGLRRDRRFGRNGSLWLRCSGNLRLRRNPRFRCNLGLG